MERWRTEAYPRRRSRECDLEHLPALNRFLAISVGLHLLLVVPRWQGAVENWQVSLPRALPKVLVTLMPGRGHATDPGTRNGTEAAPVATNSIAQENYFAGTLHRHQSAPALTAGERAPKRIPPLAPRLSIRHAPTSTAAAEQPGLPGAAAPLPTRPMAQATVAGHVGGKKLTSNQGGGADQPLDGMEPPIMLKAPQKIPLPAVLSNRDGTFSIELQCVVHVDGTAEVSVINSTGMIALDDAIRTAFTGLAWYPAQTPKGSIEVPAAEFIEGGWNRGDAYIDWHNRRPKG